MNGDEIKSIEEDSKIQISNKSSTDGENSQ